MPLLSEYYRDLFLGGFRQFEPGWQMDENCPLGFRWTRMRDLLREEFRIVPLQEKPPMLQFAVYLPEAYRVAGIEAAVDEAEQDAWFKLSAERSDGAIRLAVALYTKGELESVIDFVHRARMELMAVLDRASIRARGKRGGGLDGACRTNGC